MERRIDKKDEVVNDLLLIHEHCTQTYKTLARRIESRRDICRLVQKIMRSMDDLFFELRHETDIAHGDPADAVVIHGDLYREWTYGNSMKLPSKTSDVAGFFDQNLKGIKNSYERALEMETELPERLRSILKLHLEKLKNSLSLVQTTIPAERELAF